MHGDPGAAPTTDEAAQDAVGASRSKGGLRVAGWVLVLQAGCHVIAAFLEAYSMAASVGQAVLVEWGDSRLGVGWSDPRSRTSGLLVARRAGLGAAVGLGLAMLVLGALTATGALRIERAGSVETGTLLVSLLTSALVAWRDEFLVHGLPLRAIEAYGKAGPTAAVCCGVTSAGMALGSPDVSMSSVASAFLLGIVLGAMWTRDRGAWGPWAAHTAFDWATGTLLAGGIVHTRLAEGAWAGRGLVDGVGAMVVLVPAAAGALLWLRRRMSPRFRGVG